MPRDPGDKVVTALVKARFAAPMRAEVRAADLERSDASLHEAQAAQREARIRAADANLKRGTLCQVLRSKTDWRRNAISIEKSSRKAR